MRKSILLLQAVLLLSVGLFAQKTNKVKSASPVTVKQDNSDSVLYSRQRYRLVGPFRGGRSGAVAGSYKNRNTFYFGGTGGGVWKTQDGGSNWKNITDKYFGGTIGAVAVAPSDETVVYVGEGENTMRGNVAEGLGGIWRSDDGGKNWRNLGLKDGRHIIRIVVHPKDPNTVWVAVMGHLFGPNEERGVYKTTDGGKTWKKTLFVNNQTGCSDLVMEPGNPSVWYAGMWRVIRTPHSMESGGEGSGLYKSVDGGETWTNLSSKKGLPKGTWGIVGVAVAPSNTDKIYTIIENANGGLFMSADGGDSWTLTSNDNNIRQRAWYYSKVFVDPKNENLVYCPNVEFMRSRDGGRTFQAMNTPHGDHHDLWIDPEDGNRMIVADDGGAQVSFDGANNWSTMNNQPTGQFYRVSTDNAFPYRILGAQQDNSTVRIKSRTSGAGITERDWDITAGSESGYVQADPLNPDIVYGGNYGGYLSRLDHRTGENRAINVWPDNPMGAGADVLKYRFQWNFPFFFSPHNPKRLYAGGNHLFVTENEGQSWETISPDLTTNDKSRQASSGGPITKDNTSVEYYCTIFTAAESALEKDLLWTGSDDGLIHVSKDGGKNWENVTPAEAGKWMMWNCIETDPFKKGTAYFVGTKYKLDDFAPYIFKTEDYGKTWKRITNGIDNMHFTRALRADKKRPGLLYAGTEYGMYISYDDGANWKKFQLNLPIVPITDLTIKENDLIVATQGRSFWVLDDLSVIQQKDAELLNKNLHVFAVNDAYRTEGGGGRRMRGQAGSQPNMGENPASGVVFNYYLKGADDSSKVSITVFDKQGKPIKTFSKNAKAVTDKIDFNSGMNQFVWDMNYPPAETVEGLILWNGRISTAKAAPGKYSARFRYGKDSVDVPFVIKADPNYKMTEADYDAQVDFLLQVRDKFSEVQVAIKNIRSLRSQINEFTAKLEPGESSKEIKKMADSINKQMTAVEEALYQTKSKSGQDVLNFPIRLNDKLAGLYGVASSGQNPPSKQAREVFADLGAQSDVQLTKLKKIMDTDLKAFNKMINDKQLPVIGVKK
ncbi:MAG: glycosyl hydrolase [Chitinophagaceae bacterium]|nr:glycosyl hydrolase [Chitinophagaceae bacterium]MCA6452534.1 glycosyl hydrolase [Chitinophagaceae bacterium]MCA6456482.1 glycosyl hydrolase [Chitinophagaceae bacterium]MCA6459836.1 glycosyl hydrolase [Chitinophagaceae bacterium]MCA6465945.1 glycosyl hydrolase [Chitinophagaceae bacterium]